MKVRRLGITLLGSSLLLCSASDTMANELEAGIEHFQNHQLDEAKRLFTVFAAQHPRDSVSRYYLGRIAFDQRNFESAASWLEAAAEQQPRSADILDWLGRTYGNLAKNAGILRQASLAAKSKEAFELAVAVDPENLQAREDLITYYLAVPFFLGGSVEKAKRQAEAIKAKDTARGFLVWGVIYAHLKQYASAESAYEEAIRAAPTSPRPRLALGALLQKQGHFEEAFDALEKILELDSQNYDALYQIGKTGALSGRRLDRARACLEACLRGRPGTDSPPLSGVHFRLGMVLERQGKRELALDQYRLATALDPDSKAARDALARLGH